MPWACRRAGLSGQVSLGHVVPGPCPAGGLCCWLVGLGCVFACLLFSYWLKTPPPCSARLFLPDTKERRKNDWERAKDPRPRWLRLLTCCSPHSTWRQDQQAEVTKPRAAMLLSGSGPYHHSEAAGGEGGSSRGRCAAG